MNLSKLMLQELSCSDSEIDPGLKVLPRFSNMNIEILSLANGILTGVFSEKPVFPLLSL